MPSFNRFIEDDTGDAIALATLLEDCLREYFIMREVCDALERVCLRGNIGELILLIDVCNIGKQDMKGRSR